MGTNEKNLKLEIEFEKSFGFGKKNQLKYQYPNWTSVSVPDTETWFQSHTSYSGTIAP